jgi:hypothetical protein
MLRLVLRFVTVGALVSALAVAIWWWADPRRDWLQAPSTALALIAAVAGIPADRWAAEAQRRARTLASLDRELDQNREILADPRFLPAHQGLGMVYPRLMLGAVDTAFIAGALNSHRDSDLVRNILDWRNVAEDFNRRLDITEQRLCTLDTLSHDELAALRAIRRPDGYFIRAQDMLDEVKASVVRAAVPPWRSWLGRRRFAGLLGAAGRPLADTPLPHPAITTEATMID